MAIKQVGEILELLGPFSAALVTDPGKVPELLLNLLVLIFELIDQALRPLIILESVIEAVLLSLDMSPELAVEFIEQSVAAPDTSARDRAEDILMKAHDIGMIVRDQVPELHCVAPRSEGEDQRKDASPGSGLETGYLEWMNLLPGRDLIPSMADGTW
nr:hypothetical protein [Microvirga mediterraneensis]